MAKTIYGAAAPVNGRLIAGSEKSMAQICDLRAEKALTRYKLRVGARRFVLERSHREMLALCRLLFPAGRQAQEVAAC